WISQGVSVQEALERLNRATRYESNAGLAIDMGRRALARTAAAKGDAASFVGELFAEAVSYYISRDLPSYVAARGRIPNTSETIRLKEALRESTKRQVTSIGAPRHTPREWRRYISQVLKSLQGGGVVE